MAEMARPALVLLTIGLAGGCGLTLDLEPPEGRADAAISDFGVPKDDGPPEDGFRPADASRPDQGGADAGASDLGGPDLSRPRECAEGCSATEYCETTVRRCLETEGSCAPRPAEAECRGMPETPVCGCDHRQYRNDCAAAAAGVVVALLDECPAFDESPDWCARTAPPQTVPGCVPCYDDADCMERTTTAFECIGSTCSPSGVGRCAFNLPPGSCYYDHDCRAGERCEGAELYGCDHPEGASPVQGRCR